jgi:hypothetical protein
MFARNLRSFIHGAISDHTLQTLFFPDRLEPKLSAQHSAARALQEDAGLSALHCAVGFLEWYDPEDAPKPAYGAHAIA